MTEESTCPRCTTGLKKNEAVEGELSCPSCHGVFLPASEIDMELLSETVSAEATESTGELEKSDGLTCPVCEQSMQLIQLGEAKLDRCTVCGGVWMDSGEVLHSDDNAEETEATFDVGRYLLYSLSLPERAVRSTIGLAAGAATEAASFIVPQAFQSSKTYEIVIRNSLKFLTQDIAGVEGDEEDDETVDNYMARKAVGNFVDIAGLMTLHLSPLWLLAIVSDVAYGSKSYVLELANELKEQGLIDDTSTIHHVDDILEAVQNASGTAASTFDTPPLSVDELKSSLEETRAAVQSADYTNILPESEVKRYWNEMHEISSREDVSLLGVSGAMTMHSMGKLKNVSLGALTGIQVAGGIFSRHVLGHYVDSLNVLKEKGFYETVSESSAPYVEAVWNNFAAERETWTEQIVSGKAFGNAFSTVKGWFSNETSSCGDSEID